MPTYETLQALADFFKVSTDYLLGRTDAGGTGGAAEGVPEGVAESAIWPEGYALIRRASIALSSQEKRKLLRLIRVVAFPDEPDNGGPNREGGAG